MPILAVFIVVVCYFLFKREKSPYAVYVPLKKEPEPEIDLEAEFKDLDRVVKAHMDDMKDNYEKLIAEIENLRDSEVISENEYEYLMNKALDGYPKWE